MSSQSHAPKSTADYAVLSPLTLFFYDAWVHGFSDRFLWRCPLHELLAFYHRNVSASHLDVGVGTGLLLDRTPFPARSAITLMDVNTACLETAARRIARHTPRIVRASVLAPLPAIGPFSSVGLGYLLHCVPGSMPAKAVAFDHLKAVMAPGARLFGATIVQGSVPTPWAARRVMDFYNARGIFANRHDTVEDLEAALRSRFSAVDVRMRGQVALFEATHA
jgi:SAM-dependent methyltransferase